MNSYPINPSFNYLNLFSSYLPQLNYIYCLPFPYFYHPLAWNNHSSVNSFHFEFQPTNALSNRQANNVLLCSENQVKLMQSSVVNNQLDKEIDDSKIAKNKNLDSSILKYFNSYLKKQFIQSGKLDKIIKAKGISLTKKQFNQQIDKYVKPKKFYFNTKLMAMLWKGCNIPNQFSLLIRLALKQFLVKDFALFIREVPRLSKQSKQSYLREARRLHEKILFKSSFFK